MLYKVEVVEIYLEKVRGTGLSNDHGGVAPSLFSRKGGKLVKGTATPRAVHRPPMSSARVSMASLN